MAKVVITIEDNFLGGVKAVCEPSFETMMKMNLSGSDLTAAQAYAIFVLNQLRAESKRQGKMKLLVPAVKGGSL